MSALDKHYRYAYKGIKLDPYRIFKTYGISDPAQQHIAKKALRAGQSGKSLEQDIEEIILSCQRWKEMLKEDSEREEIRLETEEQAAQRLDWYYDKPETVSEG